MQLALILPAIAMCDHAYGQVEVHFSGGDGSHVEIWLPQSIEFEVTISTTKEWNFVLKNVIPNLNGGVTGTLNYSVNHTHRGTVTGLASGGVTLNDVTGSDLVLFDHDGLPGLTAGDVVTLYGGSITTAGYPPYPAPSDYLFDAFVGNIYGYRVSDYASNVPACASCDPVDNGDFSSLSSPPSPGDSTTIASGGETAAGLQGWSVPSGDIDIINIGAPLTGGMDWSDSPPAGNFVVDLTGSAGGGIAQTFTTVPGEQYSVSFYYANDPNGVGAATAQLTVVDPVTSDELLNEIIEHSSSQLTDPGWSLYTANFTATGASTSLALTSDANPTDPSASFIISGVSVGASSVPEPTTATLALCAAPALLVRRRRRWIRF